MPPKVRWSCSTCKQTLRKRQRRHSRCDSLTTWTCLATDATGGHDTYNRHASHCKHCSPALAAAIHGVKEANKENQLAAVEEEEKSHSQPLPEVASDRSLSTTDC